MPSSWCCTPFDQPDSIPKANREVVPGPFLSSLTQQCVSGRRFADAGSLAREAAAWATDVNSTQRGVDWQMKVDDARTKLKSVYPKIKL
jgi:hypothetical protein